MTIFTIGFTKKTAEEFFGSIGDSGVKRLIDVRLNNSSQLAGFAKKQDLGYFLHRICGIEYIHFPALAPTEGMLKEYRDGNCGWDEYAARFLDLMAERRIEETVPRDLVSGACLLCSEDEPHHCHRRLVAEYLRERWSDIDIRHLPRFDA